jgi:membrane-associated phospholipid phosphatase
MFTTISTIVKKIGEFGPLILLVTSIILLRNKTTMLTYYILFFIFSILLNIILKSVLQQPRPSIDEKTFNTMLKHKDRYVYKHGMPYDIFGMPSGHSQSVIFSTVYIYFALRDVKTTIAYLVVTLITLSQRVIDNHHTILQVVIGSTIGILLGYSGYVLSKKNIQGKLTNKKEDYGPI